MLEIIRKTMLSGLGLASLSKDKVECLAKDLAEFGKLSEKEGKEFMDEILLKSEAARNDFEKLVEKTLNNTLQKMNLATTDDLEKIKNRLAQLEKKNKAEE